MRNIMQPFDPYSMQGATAKDSAALEEWLSKEDVESGLDLFEVDENDWLWFGRDYYICTIVRTEPGDGVWC